MSWLTRLLSRVPSDFTGTLDDGEYVDAAAPTDAGHVVATSIGLWLPDAAPAAAAPSAFRRIPWHLISKVTWSDAVLTVVEATESGSAGDAVVIADRPPVRLTVDKPGLLPRTVRRRVNESIVDRHHHDMPGGGAWFVERKVPGRGIILQVRADRGADMDAVAAIAAEAAGKLRE